jgi:hypothetical protein
LISKKFEKEIVLESSVLAWIRIRIEQKCWIRIRIKSIRIHNPGYFDEKTLCCRCGYVEIPAEYSIEIGRWPLI